MSNKSNGTAFEREFAKILYKNGYWAHCMQDNRNGQPFDVIAAKNSRAYAFDCKACEGQRFEFRRIEENQRNAFTVWDDAGNYPGMLAVQFPGAVYLMFYRDIKTLEERGVKHVTQSSIKYYGYELKIWLKGREEP